MRCGAIAITAGPDGNIWFTENARSQIGTFNPALILRPVPLSPIALAVLAALLACAALVALRLP